MDSLEAIWDLFPAFINRAQLTKSLERWLSNLPTRDAPVWQCWTWGGRVDENGYARFGDGRRFGTVMCNRIAWMLVHLEEVPAELEVDHRCRNRRCVNPFHLEAISKGANLERRIWGSVAAGLCSKGHERRRLPSGQRYCPTCMSAYQRRWRDKGDNRARENAARNNRRKNSTKSSQSGRNAGLEQANLRGR